MTIFKERKIMTMMIDNILCSFADCFERKLVIFKVTENITVR